MLPLKFVFPVLSVLLVLHAAGAEDMSGAVYMEPDQILIDIVDASWPPWVQISPDFQWWLLRTPQRNPSIAELARLELKLAGMRFRPETNAPSRTRRYIDLSLFRYSDQEVFEIGGLPDDLCVLSATWSADGTKVAFTNETVEGVELWILDAATADASRLTGPVLSLTAQAFPRWLCSGEGIVCCLVPDGRGDPPVENPVPSGPIIQEATGSEAPVRTIQDLLETPHDEDLFEYYLTSQLAVIDLDGSVRNLGDQGIIWDFDPSPDAEYVLVSILHRPFSLIVRAGRFPERMEVWDSAGKLVYTVADLPVREEIPITRGSVAEGPRSVVWRNDADATLCWAEALDGGDAGAESDLRDMVLLLAAPFEREPEELALLQLRYGGVRWGNDSLAIIAEWWWPTRNIREWRYRPVEPLCSPDLISDYSWEDRYNNPGEFVMWAGDNGRQVLFTTDNGNFLYSRGEGASPEGDRPFFDRLDISTMETARLFRSEPPYFERPVMFTDSTGKYFLFRRESVTEYPNYFLRDLETGTDNQITYFPHPTPQLLGMQKELITYEREDGVSLSATLYLPPGYTAADGPLPMLMWAYPQSYVSATAAGQISGSPYEFDAIGWLSPLIWLTRGYSVLDDPAMPIVGEEDGYPNDMHIEQLVMNAQAAVDEVVRRGVADPERIAVGGYSYGAFMTANLLAHTDLFAAGLARSGTYNRTLTPFGFQSEDRSLWEAPDVYCEMSPFMHADMVNEPILLTHGSDDSNSGTFPMQSERFFAALKGLGGTARLVMLPLESHTYKARQSILHVVWETQEWLDKYVKNRATIE